MKLDLTGLHIEVTDAIQNYTEDKIKKLEKYFNDSVICHVTFSVKKDKTHVDIRVESKGRTYLAEEDDMDLYKGIESCINKVDGQARKVKTNLDKKRKQGVPEIKLDAMSIEDLSEEE